VCVCVCEGLLLPACLPYMLLYCRRLRQDRTNNNSNNNGRYDHANQLTQSSSSRNRTHHNDIGILDGLGFSVGGFIHIVVRLRCWIGCRIGCWIGCRIGCWIGCRIRRGIGCAVGQHMLKKKKKRKNAVSSSSITQGC